MPYKQAIESSIMTEQEAIRAGLGFCPRCGGNEPSLKFVFYHQSFRSFQCSRCHRIIFLPPLGELARVVEHRRDQEEDSFE